MLFLLYTWLTWSSSPAMGPPPAEGFAQGQPEMQQAMDNMVTHRAIITKRADTPSNDDTNFQSMLTSKASELLAEAEKILNSLPDTNQRQWLENFVQRMKAVDAKTVQGKNLPENLDDAENVTPVPEGLPLPPKRQETSAAPGSNLFQQMNGMVSKFPVTSPELNKVLQPSEIPSETQAVTNPAETSNNIANNNDDEDDELVRQLKSLINERPQKAAVEYSKVLDQTPTTTTQSTPVSSESSSYKRSDADIRKAELQAKLTEEIAEFKRLGGVTDDLVNDLSSKDKEETGAPKQEKMDINEAVLKFTEAGMADRGFQKFNDINNEENEISKASLDNSVSGKNIPDQAKQFPQANFNQSIPNVHPNFPPTMQAYPRPPGNYYPYMPRQPRFPYQGFPQNGFHGYPNPYIQGRYNAFVPPNQIGHFPGAYRHMMMRPQNFYNGQVPPNYNEHLMRHAGYGPYPYSHPWYPKNATLHQQVMMPNYQVMQPINPPIDTQLSEEMKRQLRDGKIIVLSDSVVRSNFNPNNGEGTTPNPPKVENKENLENETTTEK